VFLIASQLGWTISEIENLTLSDITFYYHKCIEYIKTGTGVQL
jgi:hypothetical protein